MQAHQTLLVACLGQLIDETGSRHEADGDAFLTGSKTQADGEMRLAGSAWLKRDDVFAPDDELSACQFENKYLVEIGQRLEVEAVEAFGCRELRVDPWS